MDFTPYAKYFGNENLSSEEVGSLIAYSAFFIFGIVMILKYGQKKYRVPDLLVFHGLYWIFTQNLYHWQHGEQLDQYPGFAGLMIFGLASYIAGYLWITDVKPHKKPAFTPYIIGIMVVLFVSLFILYGEIIGLPPVVSNYPNGLAPVEYWIIFLSLFGGFLLWVSYQANRK